MTKIVYLEDEIALGAWAMEIVDFVTNAEIIATNQERFIR